DVHYHSDRSLLATPEVVVLLGQLPEFIEQRELGRLHRGVGLGTEATFDAVPPALELVDVDSNVVPLDVQEWVPLGRCAPRAREPLLPANRAIAQTAFPALGAQVVV